MEKAKKITYLFGAGASYNAVPILNSLSDLMIKSGSYLKISAPQIFGHIHNPIDRNGFNNFMKFAENLINLGENARDYGTLDTYAKKLHLNSEVEELKKLKFLVSIFFTIWQGHLHTIFPLKEENENGQRVKFQKIDSRYKSLVSNFLLENDSLNNPSLDRNINFISWNYDHQLESALNLFTKSGLDFNSLNLIYPFTPLSNNHENMMINHLNGVSNFWKNNIGDVESMFDTTSLETIQNVSRRIGEIYKSDNFNKAYTFINYSWDDDSRKISHAEMILNQTDILVIIGYSFPTFNRAIDSRLLSGKNNSFDKIIYQDPNASKELLELFNIQFRNTVGNLVKENGQLQVLKKTEQFYIPPEYFPQGEEPPKYHLY